MKKLLSNKRLLLWLGIGAAVLVAVAAVVLVLFNGLTPKENTDRYQLYWNVDGEIHTQNSEDGISDRVPDQDGLYRMRFASQAGVAEFTTSDKKLVNMIDTMLVVALEVRNNEIVDAQDPSTLGLTVYKGVYVRSVSAGTITCNTSVVLNGMPVRVRISDSLQILDVRSDAEVIGGSIQAEQLDALDYVYACATEDQVYTHVFLAGRSSKSSIYWRASQQYSSTTKETTRQPDADGVYTLDFFSDGKYVELKCKDKEIVTSIDKANRFLCHTALEFDEEGYIVKAKMSSLGIKGAVGCSNYVITAYEEGVLTAMAMSGSETGAEYSVEIDEGCVIYDVSKTAKSEGRQGQRVDDFQVGDRIVLWLDANGFPVEAYITLRLTDASPYFNMQRKWSSYYKRTTREPDKNGYYYVELLKIGEATPKVYKTKDKALVDLIDSRGDRTVGIRAEGDLLTTVYEAESIFGYTNLGPRYVSMVSGTMYSAMVYKNENDVINGVYSMDCPIYDLSGCGKLSAKTELRVGDLIIIHRNAALDAQQIYVIRREMGVDYAYYNLERQYDAEKKTTTREPIDGYYVFKMANKGKVVTVKTDSKKLATQMDAFTPPVMGLVVKNGIVKYVFDPVNISGAVRVAYYSYVDKVDKDGTITATTSTGITSQFRPGENCTFYNCSQVVKSNRGEKVSGVKVGDLITGYLDRNGVAKVVYILSRETNSIAWNTQRKYNSTTGETTRVADAEGYYNYQLLINGQVKNVRTNDSALANKIDSYDGAFGVYVEKDRICSAMSVAFVKDVASSGVNGWDVVKQDGNKITLRYTKPGSEKYTGQEQKVTLSKNLKVYDVSPTAKVYGEEVKLKLGDRVRTYVDDDGKVLYAFVLSHVTRTAGGESYCSHCDQIVHWEPWTGASFAAADRHYYMNTDLEKTVVLSGSTGSASSTTTTAPEIVPYDTVLDLNGKTMKVNGSRCFTVKNSQTLTILDSVGDGELVSGGPVNGGTFNVQNGGVLNLQAGTIKGVVEEGFKGSVIYVVAGGTVNISDTAVVDGSGMTLGKGTGGAIYSSGTVNVLGGEIKGGSVGSGGSVNIQGGNLNISGGKISGGQAANYGDDIFVNNAESVVTVSGGEVSGQFQITAAKRVTLSGAPKLGNLKPPASLKLTLGQMIEGADIAVAAVGAFTEVCENAAEYTKYFRGTDNTKSVIAFENVLYVEETGAYVAQCTHCDCAVLWKPWKASYTESGHYFLNANVNRTVVYTPAGADMVIDLHGEVWETTNNNRGMQIDAGITVTIMDTVGTGVIKASGVSDGGIFAVNGGTLNFVSGAAQTLAAVNSQKGSVAYVAEGGVLNLSGGVLDASAIQNGGGSCGAVYSVGTVNISGGEIKGGSVGSGGSVNIQGGNLNISGGKISGGQAANYGDDIFVNNAESVVTVSGGEVSGQFQITAAKRVTLSGAPKLGNVKLATSVMLTLGELKSGASIAVAKAGVFTIANENAKTYLEAGYFTTVSNKESVKVTADGVLYVPACPHCNLSLGSITWKPWDATTAKTTSGHYYLTAAVETSNQFVPTAQDVVIDLRGNNYTIKSTASNVRAFLINSGISLTIMDTTGNGIVTGRRTTKGSAYCVQGGGILNLYGGTTVAGYAATEGSVAYVETDGTLNISGTAVLDGSAVTTGSGTRGTVYSKGDIVMTGGEIKGASTGSGGSIYVASGDLTISGGKISGGQAVNYGDDIFVNNADSVVTVSGGEVSGQFHVDAVKTITVLNAPRLGNMKLASAVMLTLGELKPGASIAVAKAGAFTVANNNAKFYLDEGYFTCLTAGKTIREENGVLIID